MEKKNYKKDYHCSFNAAPPAVSAFTDICSRERPNLISLGCCKNSNHGDQRVSCSATVAFLHCATLQALNAAISPRSKPSETPLLWSWRRKVCGKYEAMALVMYLVIVKQSTCWTFIVSQERSLSSSSFFFFFFFTWRNYFFSEMSPFLVFSSYYCLFSLPPLFS